MSEQNENPQTPDTPDTPELLTEEQKKAGIILRDHSYDGIYEYDQKLPNWWLFTLYIMVVWFVVFWFAYYQLGAFETVEQDINGKLALIDAEKAKQVEKLLANLNNEAFWEKSRDPAVVEAGEGYFQATCAVCHGEKLDALQAGTGAQLPGLALDDPEWKYGGQPLDLFQIIMKGSPDVTKGMISWESTLGGAKVVEIVAYLLSHHEEGAPTTWAPDSPNHPDGPQPVATPPTETPAAPPEAAPAPPEAAPPKPKPGAA